MVIRKSISESSAETGQTPLQHFAGLRGKIFSERRQTCLDSGQNSSVYQCMPSLEALKIFDSLLESKGTGSDAACVQIIRLEDEGDVFDLYPIIVRF